MYEYKAIVERIIDGDSIILSINLGFDIVLANQNVRLNGVDTPESRTRDLVEKKFGLIAKHYVEKFCPVGTELTVITMLDKKGKFGRILGEVFVDDVSLNQRLIEGHYAVAYHGQNKADIQASHLANRQKLMEAGIV